MSIDRGIDRSVWAGRIDAVERGSPQAARRWHQCIEEWRPGAPSGVAVLGFACDAGVVRNEGRAGASAGPTALRRVLANLAWHGSAGLRCYDAGDVRCDDGDLEAAQARLGERVAELLQEGQWPLLFGGGHEIAWGSFQGLLKWRRRFNPSARLGVVNFDAHFDLRPLPPDGRGTSGTPFRQ
ncbi:MAG: arginase family protein, partial [Gammaproteobacteria bacterium]|nr:arginase family protein [Gammaproteobacteria bacterium]